MCPLWQNINQICFKLSAKLVGNKSEEIYSGAVFTLYTTEQSVNLSPWNILNIYGNKSFMEACKNAINIWS